MSQEELTQYLGYWVKRLYLLSNQHADAQLQPFGLGRTQWQLLYILAHHGPVAQRRLQDLLHVESATLTSLVASLVRKGWVQQRPIPAKQRAKEIVLTPAGKKHWQSLPDPIQTIHEKISVDISSKELDQARRVLQRAVRNLEQNKE